MGASLNLERITKVKESTHGVDHVTEGAVKKKAFKVRSANEVLENAAGQDIHTRARNIIKNE